jgi:hypothetical protein
MKKIITTSLVLASALMADPFVAYPGTKAKGMAGAFTAVANNNSAMYFNPAGMTNFESDENHGMFTLEVGKGAGYNSEESVLEDKFSDSTAYFLAWGTSGSGLNGGIALYNLYTIRAQVLDESGSYLGYRDQDISVISGSLSYELMKEMYPMGGKLSIGATLGLGYSGGGTLTSDTSGTDEEIDAKGTLMAVGVKARIFNSMTFKVDVGANYRAQTKMESVDDELIALEQIDAMDIPEEKAFGIAAMYFTEYGVFTLALDQKTTNYEDATSWENSSVYLGVPNYKTTAVGLDYSGPLLNLRGGIYKSTPDTDSIEISGITFGAGFEWENGLMVEASVDQKSYEHTSWTESIDKSLLSVSLNWTF